jgi:hypothetical protein
MRVGFSPIYLFRRDGKRKIDYDIRKSSSIIYMSTQTIVYTENRRSIKRARPKNQVQIQEQDPKSKKQEKGQFYTTQCDYILDGLFECIQPMLGSSPRIIEPFAGKGDLVEWIKRGVKENDGSIDFQLYDIDPKYPGTIKCDTLATPPLYQDSWILTNPPYLARNKCSNKTLFDKYSTNDLYKCFLTSLSQQAAGSRGGIIIIPSGFFFSPRDVDVRCRNSFMSKYRILRINYFEESVFQDTSTTVVAIAFAKSVAESLLENQQVSWTKYPSKETRIFEMSKSNNWIIGGEIYRLVQNPICNTPIIARRHVEGNALKHDEQQTHITLTAVDSGSQSGRIKLEYKAGYIYPAEECSRTYATLRIRGKHLSPADQEKTCTLFNEYIEMWRTNTWSLFLPQFRESKEYARKRIPFELAYRIVEHIISSI